jgi:hypothetical protein
MDGALFNTVVPSRKVTVPVGGGTGCSIPEITGCTVAVSVTTSPAVAAAGLALNEVVAVAVWLPVAARQENVPHKSKAERNCKRIMKKTPEGAELTF